MIVVVDGKDGLWEIDMTWRVFECFKRTTPNMEVELKEATPSMYKKYIKVPIGIVTDYSKWRNENALRPK